MKRKSIPAQPSFFTLPVDCLIFSYYYPSVIMEMNERREFMKEMESLGKGHQYKTQIDAEISQVILHF